MRSYARIFGVLCLGALVGCGKGPAPDLTADKPSVTSKDTQTAIKFEELKSATGEDLARIVAGVLEKKPPDVDKIRVWQEMLDNKAVLITDGELAEVKIQVRDLALLLAEAAIGDGMQHCGPRRAVEIKKKISCPSEEHGRYRFDICLYTDEDFERAKQHIGFWLSGFDEGTGEKSRYRDYPAE